MNIKNFTLNYKTTAAVDVLDITKDVASCLSKAEIKKGHVIVFVPGSTAAITTIEYESGVIKDLIDAIERMAPRDISYRHDARWGDGNGYAHVRAALLGPSVNIPVDGGRMLLGTWQQIVLVDSDNRPRTRQVIVQVCGI
ncbi:MAG: secondary thiamine-phosphate synthase enzyme YjbQ [Syntrophales bacterium]|nr:secondary thiamine-phosphate synthase enzyme YjbQ [Syntrophales bacterium]